MGGYERKQETTYISALKPRVHQEGEAIVWKCSVNGSCKTKPVGSVEPKIKGSFQGSDGFAGAVLRRLHDQVSLGSSNGQVRQRSGCQSHVQGKEQEQLGCHVSS